MDVLTPETYMCGVPLLRPWAHDMARTIRSDVWHCYMIDVDIAVH